MDRNEATTNMVVALINLKAITSPDEVAEAYKKIYKAVLNPTE